MSLPTIKDYSLLEKIGSGSYAIVYKAFRKGGSKDVVAIKSMDKSTLSTSAIENIITEISLLKILKHDHIVEMKDFFWDDRYIYIVMEYCDGGDLSSFIRKKHRLPENICRKFLQQLALALRFLRSHNICHMDLKPQNLLLVKKPKLTLKVGDFGFAQYLANSEHRFNMRGSPLYMAPEILLDHKYDARVDLWSVGIIMYECLFGKAPYSSSSFQELAEKIKDRRPIELPKNAYITAECKDLITSLLKHNPTERMTFDEFFGHEFLDLRHAPTTDNYDKAVALVQQAVQLDKEKNQKEAFHLYCESLRYFIPLLTNETDPQRKEILRLRINDYIKRAEELKRVYAEGYTDIATLDENRSILKVPSESSGVMQKTESQDNEIYRELYTLSKSTTGMPGALEIGEAAEQYLSEGKYAIALEKFKSALEMLVPLLAKEPVGRRRDLLHKQVQLWMKEGESTKALLSTKNLEESTRQSNYSHLSEQCVLQ
ncbi:serine/threonine-protein kinase ULK3 [Athalia rosae]|uniref:serine/threonine-protein kinase ULK3 n=1 Tax=Athalia rosae TaxID=37344 RepID=UPI0020337A1E|nr:serine/threonine-protein kinase ULK3 [Athalia rosae]